MITAGKTASRELTLFIYIFAILLTLYFSILFDIPIVRQVSGFTFLTFIPGLLILCIFKSDRLEMTEKAVLCVGLSMAFNMFAGLLINTIYPFFGNRAPLTTSSLLISFSTIIVMLTITVYFRNSHHKFVKAYSFQLNAQEKIYLLLPAIFPLLAIFGMRIMNSNGNNIMLIMFVSLIPIYLIFMAIVHRKVPDRIYAPIIFCISISFLLMFAFVSNHIFGSDSHSEFSLFRLTMLNSHWQIFQNISLDSCLSISILPTVYQSFMNMDAEYLFKFIYVLPLAMTPLIVFIFSKKYLGNFYAFLSSIFLMAQVAFFSQTAAYRNYIAIFFFGLALMIIFHNQLGIFNKRLFFIIFSTCIIVSHYSTAYIFCFILLFTWITSGIIHRIMLFRSNWPYLVRDGLNRNRISIISVMLLFIILFFWYDTATGAAFYSGVNFIKNAVVNLQKMFISEMRAPEVSASLGSGLGISPILSYINFVTSWLSVIFIAIGLISLIVRQKYATEWKMDFEFLVLALVCSAILTISAILPFVSTGYSFGRLYYQFMIVFSTFFVIGGIMTAQLLKVKANWSYSLILVALIPLFMNSSGILPQYFSIANSVIINPASTVNNAYYYIYDSEACGAKWMKRFASSENEKIYTDHAGQVRLWGLANIEQKVVDSTKLVNNNEQIKDGYIYLGYINTNYHQLHSYSSYQLKWETTNLDAIINKFNNKNLIYSNGGSQVWK